MFAAWIDSIVGSSNDGSDNSDNSDNDGTNDDVPEGNGTSDDHGNEFADATSLALDSDGFAVIDAVLEEYGDRDLFAFELDEPALLLISVSSINR